MNNLLVSIAHLSESLKAFSLGSLGPWYLVLFNAFGVFAIITKVTEFQLKSRKTILLFAMIASMCWVLYFGLQGDFTSSLSCLIVAVEALAFSMRNKYKWLRSIFWLFFFVALQIVMCVFTYQAWYNVLPVIAGVFGTIAYYVMDEDKYRIFIFIYVLFWLANSIVNFYFISLLSDSMSTVSSAIAIVRFNILKRHKVNKKADKNSDKINSIEVEK